MMKISKDIYERDALLKAVYAFTNEAYFHLDADSAYYLVDFYPKGDTLPVDLENRFENELIAQQTRRTISHNTKSIREMIIARALASTIVDVGSPEISDEKEYSAEEILKDWFDNHE